MQINQNSFVYQQIEKNQALHELNKYRNSIHFHENYLNENKTVKKVASLVVLIFITSFFIPETNYTDLIGSILGVSCFFQMKFIVETLCNRFIVDKERAPDLVLYRHQYFNFIIGYATIFKPQFASKTELGKTLPIELWLKIRDYSIKIVKD